MKNSLVYVSSILLGGLVCGAAMAQPMKGVGKTSLLIQAHAWAAPQQAAGEKKGPQWKSTDEYNAFQAAANEKDPHKKITLAGAFLTKYTDTDFKDLAYLQEMSAYQQLGDGTNAIKSGEKALESNPDNLEALRFVCFALPF